MKNTSIEYVAIGTKGVLYAKSNKNNGSVTSVAIDSRNVSADTLFFCIIGERNDAHEFLPDVLDRGCRNVVLSSQRWADEMKDRGDVNVILVEDTRIALMNLATKYLEDWPELIRIGVTGSVGKTSTKEFIYSALKDDFRVGKTKGNLNSEFGIPLTVFDFEEDIDIGVIEIGVGYGSYMDELSMMVRPDIAVITTIGSSHVEVFGNREKLLQEKLKITNGFGRNNSPLKENCLIVNYDCDLLTEENIGENTAGEFKTIGVSTRKNAYYRLFDVCDLGIDGVKCMIGIESDLDNKIELKLPVIGAHNLTNAAEAVAVAGALGVDVKRAIHGLENAESFDNRLAVIRGKKYTVINDTYNASPESMKAGIDVLAASKCKRSVAILGSMFELGNNEEELHRSVGRHAVKREIGLVVTIGKNGRGIYEGTQGEKNTQSIHFDDKKQAIDGIEKILEEGDLILVKASRSMKLEDVVEKITGQRQ